MRASIGLKRSSNQPQVYMCGECVVACLDFNGAERCCKRACLSLESHETLLLKRELL
jgi:hypothetical protein